MFCRTYFARSLATLGVVVAALAESHAPAAAQSSTYYVSTDGSDTNPGT